MSVEDIEKLATKAEASDDDSDDSDKDDDTDDLDKDDDSEDADSEDDDQSDTDDDSDDDDVDDTDSEDGTDDDKDSDEITDDDTSSKAQPFDESKSKTKGKKEEKKDADLDDESVNGKVNYQAEHEKLLAPFRANNKNMQVDSVDEARTLMQMGANYNKKMAGLKPSLKIVKMLENNDLLDEDKLSFLIDLDKKNPEAIAKFIKDSGIDPLELDLDTSKNYKSNTYTVNDKEVELDGILADIKDTESFNKTIDIIGNKWDEQSKQILLEQPDAIKVINDHVATGIYDKIDEVLSKERAMGRFIGVPDVEAYQQIGDAINAAGGFAPSDTQNTNSSNSSKNSSKSKSNKSADPEVRKRKKAAGLTKPASGKKRDADFNPLSMSDEDIEKMTTSKFI